MKDKTIAILPFVNMSSNSDHDFFSDGITEEVINALAKIPELKVTSRTSSFFFKNLNIPIPEVGAKLGVSTILEGSIRLYGNTIRITAQLIQAKEDFHFWSETWDRKLDNIFEIQDEISLLIADKLREHFGHIEIGDHLIDTQTKSFNAYEYCLKGRFHKNKWNPEDVNKAISFYKKALELDPEYPEAFLGLADCFSFLGTTSFMSFEEAWDKTIQYTSKANTLNNELSGVHYQLSNQAFFLECNYNKSLLEMKRAVELNPSNADAHQFISFLYIIAGKREKANSHLEDALSLNPLSEETHFFRAYFHYMTEDYQLALELLNKCLLKNDKNIPAHSVKTLCLLMLGKYKEVINYFDSIPSDVVIEGEKTGSIGLAYSLLKVDENSRIYYQKLKDQASKPNGFTADSYLFFMYCINGQIDQAFNWAYSALENKSSLLMLRYTDPIVRSLKADSRYEILKEKIYKTSEQIGRKKVKKDLLDEITVSKYSDLLIAHLEKEQPFLNPTISLRELAAQIDIHPNHLSWLLNKGFGKNYNEFINQYRLEDFKIRAKEDHNLTIEGLAYESGFNSKTVFNTFFKKEMGITPVQYLNQQK